MKKQYPSDQGLLFLLCDDVRVGEGQKPMLFGLYPDRKMVVPSPLPPRASIESLALFAAFTDGEGTFQARLEVTDPEGKPAPQQPAREVVKEVDGVLTIVSKFIPFPVKVGEFTASFYLDEHRYTRNFRVQERPTK